MNEIDEFKHLIDIIDRLLGPGGCPWDREQTLRSLRSDLIEEASEVVEAIDLNESHHIQEELGDLLFVTLFLCRIAEKEKHCNMTDALRDINEKLIRRHPHVFGDVKIDNSAAVLEQWGEIKRKEKGKAHRKSAVDGIPKQLPALARSQKMLKKMRKANYFRQATLISSDLFEDESSLGEVLLDIAGLAAEKGINAEHALRKALTGSEKQFRAFEKEASHH